MNHLSLAALARIEGMVGVLQAVYLNWSFNNFGASITNGLNSIVDFGQSIAVPVAAVAFIGIGFMFFMGRKGADIAKPWVLYVLVGVFIVFGAFSAAQWARTTSGF